MDDHTAYVELLAELEGAGKAPKDHGGAVLCVVGTRYMWGRFGAEYIEAHYAIRVTAEDMLREWCKARGWRGYFIGENDDGSISIEGRAGFTIVGTGPTLAVALLNAVRAVRGMKEKK